jgi:hypothetical protein
MTSVQALPVWKRWSWEQLIKESQRDPKRVQKIMLSMNNAVIPYQFTEMVFELWGYIECATQIHSSHPESILNQLRFQALELRKVDAITLDQQGLKITDYLGDERLFSRGRR